MSVKRKLMFSSQFLVASLILLLWGGKASADEVSFADDVQPVFDAHCTRCHNPELRRGGMDLTCGAAYQNLVNADGTGVRASQACQNDVADILPEGTFTLRVDPGCATSSQLILKTRPSPHEDGRCRGVMPFMTLGLGVISPDEFDILLNWVNQGARDN